MFKSDNNYATPTLTLPLKGEGKKTSHLFDPGQYDWFKCRSVLPRPRLGRCAPLGKPFSQKLGIFLARYIQVATLALPLRRQRQGEAHRGAA
jgi:hypothetical protein